MDKLKQFWNENPLGVISLGIGAVTAVAKILDSVSSAQSRRAYTKQVNYRVKKKK